MQCMQVTVPRAAATNGVQAQHPEKQDAFKRTRMITFVSLWLGLVF